MKKIIKTQNAPQAIGPYSQAIIIDGFLYSSGQIALTPEGKFLDEDIQTQTRQVLKNLEAILKEAGASLDDVIKTTIFLDDIKDFDEVNKVYAEFFKENKPARSTVAVDKLPKGAKVEIECIAKIST
jgi:2-iminobutanoate/2-iminopropanoate deaminase